MPLTAPRVWWCGARCCAQVPVEVIREVVKTVEVPVEMIVEKKVGSICLASIAHDIRDAALSHMHICAAGRVLAACSARTAVYYLAWLHSGTVPGLGKLPPSLTMAGYRSSIFYEPLLMTLFRRANRFSLAVCRHYAARSQL